MVLAYRNDEEVLQARLGSLLDNRSAEVAAISSELRDVYAGRVARSVAGGVAAIGGAALLAGGIIRCVESRSLFNFAPRAHDGLLLALLGGSALAGALAYPLARRLAARAFDRSMRHALSLSGNVRIDLVRVERAQPRRIARDLVASNEGRSAALPLAAMALLAPLGLHFLVWLVIQSRATSPALDLGAFDTWIALSAPIAGVAHLVLVMLCALFGMRLAGKSTAEIRKSPAQEGWYAFAITSVAGMIPGALLLLIPPIIIALTGIVLIPVSFFWMNQAIVRERAVVESLAE